MPPKSARYQFSYELEDHIPPRVNDQRIPGGKKSKITVESKVKGGKMGIAPSPLQIKVGGKKVVTRNEIYETEEGVKNPNNDMEGGGLFSDLGSLIDGVVGGKRKPEAKQRQPIKLPNPQEQENEITEDAIVTGQGYTVKAGNYTVKAGGLFSDIGQALDGVSSIIGLGKKSVKSPNGDIIVAGKITKKKKGDMRKAVKQLAKELSAGAKKLLDQLK